jgi:hypothetical protein
MKPGRLRLIAALVACCAMAVPADAATIQIVMQNLDIYAVRCCGRSYGASLEAAGGTDTLSPTSHRSSRRRCDRRPALRRPALHRRTDLGLLDSATSCAGCG